MLYYPAEVLGDDELWARIRPLVATDFEARDGAMLAAQWQACLDYDSSEKLPGCDVPIHAIAFSHDVQTPPARVREVAELAGNGRFHLLEGLGHGSAFGHRPEVANACLRAIMDDHLAG
jgi:pimeloyl-ACP methyl ester carboxylesterase